MCGQIVKGRAVKCRHCGEFFDDSAEFGGDVWGTRHPVRFNQEQQDAATAVQILFTALFPCFAPIVAVYGLIFLTSRRYQFRNRNLAVAGTIIHWVWTTAGLVYLLAQM